MNPYRTRIPLKAIEAALGPLPALTVSKNKDYEAGFNSAVQLVTEEMGASLAEARPFLLSTSYVELVPSLYEAARCLGVAQAKEDAAAIDHWTKESEAILAEIRRRFQAG